MNNQDLIRGASLSRNYDQVEQPRESIPSEEPTDMAAEPMGMAANAAQGNNKIRQINIEELNRGFIVRVGCHTFAISTKEELTAKLTEYINDPDKTEKLWFSGELF